MKRIALRILCSMLAVMACITIISQPLALAAASGVKVTAVVNNPNPSDRLHLRTEPRTTATSLGKYYNGVPVEVLSYPNDTWVEVRISGVKGYMLKNYLAFGVDTNSVKRVTPTVYVSLTNPSSTLNLRASMSENSASHGKYKHGTAVEVLGVGTTWHHVHVDGKTGYMMVKHLTPVDGGNSQNGNTSQGNQKWLTVNNPNPADRLHLRTTPRADATSLGKYYNGVSVEVLSYPNADWAKVRIGNTDGYMMRKFLTTGVEVEPAYPVMMVNNPGSAGGVTMRSSASETSTSLGWLSNDTFVFVLGVGPDWHHVRLDNGGSTGYVMAKHLR